MQKKVLLLLSFVCAFAVLSTPVTVSAYPTVHKIPYSFTAKFQKKKQSPAFRTGYAKKKATVNMKVTSKSKSKGKYTIELWRQGLPKDQKLKSFTVNKNGTKNFKLKNFHPAGHYLIFKNSKGKTIQTKVNLKK